MRHFAMTGMETAAMISRIFLGDAMRATPPSARICAGTRSRAMTATAPDFSAMVAWSALVTSMMTPPLSISARPVLRRRLVLLPLDWDMCGLRKSSCQRSAVSSQLNLFVVVLRWGFAAHLFYSGLGKITGWAGALTFRPWHPFHRKLNRAVDRSKCG